MAAHHQFARFCIVGLVNTAITLTAFTLAVTAGIHYLPASCAAFALGALNGYTLNRVWTFKGTSFSVPGVARYAVVQSFGLGANTLLMAAFVGRLGLATIPTQAAVLPLVTALTFTLNRRWTFTSAGDGSKPNSAFRRRFGSDRNAAPYG